MVSNPVIVGVAQFTQRKDDSVNLDPLNLMAKTSRLAIENTTVDEIVKVIDSVYLVNTITWAYKDAPKELSEILGIQPQSKVFLPDGGDSPQMLVNRAAKAITKQKTKAVLITGAEAWYSITNARKRNLILNWPEKVEPDYMEGKMWDGITQFINKYIYKRASQLYALFETAVRGASGRNIEEHKRHMGYLFETYSEIASKNPYAWNQESYTASDIVNPTTENRYINHPYTKRMCSNMFVDQSASLIMTSEKVAEELGIDRSLWVYIMGGSDMKNVHDITRRPRLYDSPAIRFGSQLALKQAGLTLNDISAFDLYSCFPSIVEILIDGLGIEENDPRALTITGGLPFFGGPWSNYSLHAIVTAVRMVRNIPLFKIMVVANGGYNSKQSIGIYGTEPPAQPWGDRDDTAIQEEIYSDVKPEPVENANGTLTIDGYTIVFDRNGKPENGVVIGTLENGSRTMAYLHATSEKLMELEQQELVGNSYTVRYDPEVDRNIIEL